MLQCVTIDWNANLLLYIFQRQLMEAYVRQKRAAPGMVQASDMRPMSAATGRSASQHLLQQHSPQSPHAYDGPMQFMMSPHNPDQTISVSPNNEGIVKYIRFFF